MNQVYGVTATKICVFWYSKKNKEGYSMDLFEKYKHHIIVALEDAEKNQSKINDEILKLEGYTGSKTRHFYNNLLNIDDARYLEIGMWKGSSLSAAMFQNDAIITCIDNYSEFGGIANREILHNNIIKYMGNNKVQLIEDDCFNVNTSIIEKKNIYLYDGNHSYESHYKALVHYLDILDDMFILVIDDWNWETVRKGTRDAIELLNLKVLFEKEIMVEYNDTYTYEENAYKNWWNGMYVGILEKKK